MTKNNTVREPLFSITKRGKVSLSRQILARVIAVVSGLLFGSLICAVVYKKSPFLYVWGILKNNFLNGETFNDLILYTAILLIIGVALIPAFKMKFWNLGGNGQIFVGGLVTIYCMVYLGGKLPDVLVWLIMIVGSVLAGAIWGAIPAIFKAFFKTNETLFTLMMNYIASCLVAFAIKDIGGPKCTGTIGNVETGNLPEIINKSGLTIIVAILLTAFMAVYMKKSKHGFEISVVGDSENTARYIGINVKKVIIRTMVMSGAICGLLGCLLTGAINHTIVTDETMSLSGFSAFTAIIAVWIAHNNPIATVGVSFGIMFLTKSMSLTNATFGITNDSVSNMIIGLLYLLIIACEFFITYQIKRNKASKTAKEEK